MTDRLAMNSTFWNASKIQSSSFLSFLERSLKPLAVYTPQGEPVYASQSLLELLQVGDTLVSFFDYFSRSSTPQNVLRAYWERALKGEPTCFLTFFKEDLGEIECLLEFDSNTNLMFAALVAKSHSDRAIYDLVQAHEQTIMALIKTKQYWKNFISNSPYFFIQTSHSGQIIYSNAIAQQLLGYREEELAGRHITELIHPRHFSEFEFIFQQWRSLLRLQPLGIECWWRTKARQWIALYIKGQRFPSTLDLDGVAISGYSITERKHLQHKQKVIEKQFQSLLEIFPGAVFYCDLSYVMKFVSQPIEDITGYSPSTFVNNHLHSYLNIIHQDDISLIRDSLVQSTSGHPHTIEYRIIHANGQVKWVSERKQGVFNRNGNLLWLCGILTDISDLKHNHIDHQSNLRSNYKGFPLRLDLQVQ